MNTRKGSCDTVGRQELELMLGLKLRKWLMLELILLKTGVSKDAAV